MLKNKLYDTIDEEEDCSSSLFIARPQETGHGPALALFLSDRVDSRRAVPLHPAVRDQPMAPVLAVFVVDFYRGLERHRHLYDVQPAAAAARRTLGRRSEAGLRGCCFSAGAVSDPHRRPTSPCRPGSCTGCARDRSSPQGAFTGSSTTMVDGPVRPLRFRHGDTSLVRCVRSASVRGPGPPASDDGKHLTRTPDFIEASRTAEGSAPTADSSSNSPRLSRSSRNIRAAPVADLRFLSEVPPTTTPTRALLMSHRAPPVASRQDAREV
jgi:hypothetical protein